jgi:hypothetical protein
MNEHPRPRYQGDGLEEYSAIEPTSDAAEDIQPGRPAAAEPTREATQGAVGTPHGAMHDEAAVEAEEEVDFSAPPRPRAAEDAPRSAGQHGAMHDEAAAEAEGV